MEGAVGVGAIAVHRAARAVAGQVGVAAVIQKQLQQRAVVILDGNVDCHL